MSIDAQMTLAELVVEHPSWTRILERLGLDFCCGGKQTLADACAEKALDVRSVAQMLAAFAAVEADAPKTEVRNWAGAALAELCDHIEQVHHQYLRDRLPRVGELVETVRRVHGGRHPELAKLAGVVSHLSAELRSHMEKEEHDLFPILRELDGGVAAAGEREPRMVSAAVQLMVDEHEETGAALSAMRRLTHDYAPPEDACHTYRRMLEELAALESDLHHHIHKENNILFPRSVALLTSA